MYLAYDQSCSSQKVWCVWDVEVFAFSVWDGEGQKNEAVMSRCDTSKGITLPLLTSSLSSREGLWDDCPLAGR